MSRGDHPKTFLQSLSEHSFIVKSCGWVGGGWWPMRLYCHLLGLGVLSISHSHFPSPGSLGFEVCIWVCWFGQKWAVMGNEQSGMLVWAVGYVGGVMGGAVGYVGGPWDYTVSTGTVLILDSRFPVPSPSPSRLTIGLLVLLFYSLVLTSQP